MQEIYHKYTELLKENADLKLRISYLQDQLQNIEKENFQISKKTCKCELTENKHDESSIQKKENSNEEQKRKEITKQQRRIISGLFGYKMDIIDNKKIILRSMYSFDEDDCFIFESEQNSFSMMPSSFTENYRKEIDTFVVKGRSVSAFLAHVTLDLFSQNTLQ